MLSLVHQPLLLPAPSLTSPSPSFPFTTTICFYLLHLGARFWRRQLRIALRKQLLQRILYIGQRAPPPPPPSALLKQFIPFLFLKQYTPIMRSNVRARPRTHQHFVIFRIGILIAALSAVET